MTPVALTQVIAQQRERELAARAAAAPRRGLAGRLLLIAR
jgi:hypothetical protein